MTTTIELTQRMDIAEDELLEHLLLYSRSGARPYIEGPPAPLEVLIPLSAGQLTTTADDEEVESTDLDGST